MGSNDEEERKNQLETLIKQIVHERKGVNDEQRLIACDQFREAILSVGSVSKLNYDWRELAKELLTLLSVRISSDVKRSTVDCLGSIGFVLTACYSEYLDFMLDAINKVSPKYVKERSLILASVCTSLEMIGAASPRTLSDLKPVEEVMKAVKKFLESNESPVVLIPLLNICLAVAKHFPTVFKAEFMDVVDFTVGWYTELDQPVEVIKKCGEVLSELKPYFHDSVSAALELMTQFVEDAKVYVEELSQKDVKVEVSLKKAALLLRSLATVLKNFDPPGVPALLVPFAEKVYTEMDSVRKSLSETYLSEVKDLFMEMIPVYWSLVQITTRPKELGLSVDAMSAMVAHPSFDVRLLTKMVEFYEKVFDELPPDMTADVLPSVFDSLMNSKYSKSNAAAKFLTKILTPKALPTLKAAYACTRKMLFDRFRILEEEFENTSETTRARTAEEEALMLLGGFTPLALVKNSVIAMMGLSPDRFTMLAEETPLLKEWFIVRYPSCHCALLHLLKLHCERHDNFISKSALFGQTTGLTANYATRILTLFADLLPLTSFMWADTRNILLDWICGFTFALSPEMLQQIMRTCELRKLRQALLQYFLDNSLPKKTCSDVPKKSFGPNGIAAGESSKSSRVRQLILLRRLAVFDLVYENFFTDGVKFTRSVFEAVRKYDPEKAFGLWQAIPPAIYINSGLSQVFKNRCEIPQFKICGASFTASHFKMMTDFLLNSTISTYLLSGADDNWLVDIVGLVYSSATKDYGSDLDCISKWRWALAQTAQFCIDNRMKTHLGKPLETFLAFEKEIRRLAIALLTEHGNTSNEARSKDGKVEKEEGTAAKQALRKGRSAVEGEESESEVPHPRQLTNAEEWWRVRALLETIELLDRLISYAGDGAVFQLSNVSQSARQFFITNATSCSSWLSRMCLLLMAVAYRNGNYAQVVRFGGRALRDAQRRSSSPVLLEKNGKDSETGSKTLDSTTITCVSWMVRALIELGGVQAILGLYAWIKKTFDVTCEWIVLAADLASGRIEQALDGLLKYAADETLSENAAKVVRQLILTCLNVSRCKEDMVRVWTELCKKDSSEEKALQSTPNGFEESAWNRTRGLVSFTSPSAADENAPVPWDVENRFQSVELRLMDTVKSSNKSGRVDLMHRLGEDAYVLMLADTNSKLHAKASVLHLLASGVRDTSALPASEVIDWLPRNVAKGSALDYITVCQQMNAWLENCRNETGTSTVLRIVADEPSFHLNLCSLARKAGNYNMARRQLMLHHDFYHRTVKLPPTQNGWPPGFEKECLPGMVNGVCSPFCGAGEEPQASRLFSSRIEAKLRYVQGKTGSTERVLAFAKLYDAVSDEVDRLLTKSNALFNGAPTVAPNALTVVLSHQLMLTVAEGANFNSSAMPKRGSISECGKMRDVNALSRSILNLADWLEEDSNLTKAVVPRSNRIAFHMFGAEMINLPQVVGATSGLVGSLLSAACKLSFHLAKAHARFADWAYRCVKIGDDDNAGMTFTDDERGSMAWHLKSLYPSLEKDTIDAVVQAVANAEQVKALKDDVFAALGEDYNRDDVSEKLFGKNSVLMEMWGAARSRMVAYFISCVHSYFAYINEYGRAANEGEAASQGSIGTVVACLRILQLFLKHPESLQSIMDVELSKTDESIWKDILPQLFARLNHPLLAVRNSLCLLLERIAEKAPHALCYPAIVGAIKPIVVMPEEEEEMTEKSDETVELVDEERKMRIEADRSLMYECCQRIVSRLSHLFPDLVKNVSEFVKELQRINMLFEERWIFVLANLDHEMNRRIAQIEAEKARTLASTHLNPKEQHAIIKEKTVTLSSMVFNVLEALYERTCVREPTTVNERQFRDAYYPQISAAFEAYAANKHEPKKTWQPFKQLLLNLTQRSNKRGALNLQTSDISPRLCALKNTRIPLPGQELKAFSEVVTIEQITRQAIILPTKTRPKKISFIGSDGKEYPFLFKGQEDLHLDERIMQLLRICNLMLLEKKTEWPPYSARHYSVTPLGSRSGLIQWVDGATPLFHVYRKWQMRKAAANVNLKKESTEVDRPSELFFKKLKAAFGANNISTDALNDRQKWPLPILRNVVAELIKETPCDLLSRELWLRAGSSDTWYRVTERFARSTAVMSMLGSILGLGDRHLDNVLVDLESGHVVHIDYNVCFEKGRNLRVPETVPFRLTNNIVHALGPTQIEGTFRLSCEHMLKKLRAGKEVLLTILDTFVYDPLVDWAAAQEHMITSGTIGVATLLAVYGSEPFTDTALPLTYSLFSLRVKEFGVPWRSNGDRLHYALMRMIEALEKTHRSREGILDYGSMVKGKAPGENVKAIESERNEASLELKTSINEHKRLMHDFRPLLRSLAYSDEKFREYLRLYKDSFIEPLFKACKLLEQGDGEEFSAVAALLQSVNGHLDSVFDKLVTLNKKDEKAVVQSSCPSSKLPAEAEEEKSMSKKQEQNVYAKNISTRVKQKLEGKEYELYRSKSDEKIESGKHPSDDEPLSSSQQADMWIRQATSLSNLALMYEGWTAWV